MQFPALFYLLIGILGGSLQFLFNLILKDFYLQKIFGCATSMSKISLFKNEK